jgi:muramoyltetrapeptide carboxypeptidase
MATPSPCSRPQVRFHRSGWPPPDHSGQASGPLFGGNLEMLARSVGVLEPDLSGHVLLLEINKAAGLGNVDRALTQLIMSGTLHGIIGVALGWLAGFEDYEDRGWTILDVLRDRFAVLDVPVLAGLPLGYDPDPRTVPLSTDCRLDADHGYLTCQSPTEDATWRADRAVQ